MKYVQQLRKDLLSHSVIFAYQGILSEESRRPVVSVIERKMDLEPDRVDVKRKVYITLVQCLQDIIHRNEGLIALQQLNGPYIFLVSTTPTHYHITCGYYISNEVVDLLKTQIEHLNNLGNEELRKMYNKALHTEAGKQYENKKLDLLYLRRKSSQKIMYIFEVIDETNSYFAYTISIYRERNDIN